MDHESSTITRAARASLLAAVLLAATAQTPPPAPDVRLSFVDPPFAFAAACEPAKPLAFLTVKARNYDTVNAGFTVGASDPEGLIAGGFAVPPLAPGASTTVTVPLFRGAAAPSASLPGQHAISVFVKGRPVAGTLGLQVPAGFCPPDPPAKPSSKTRPRETVTLYDNKGTISVIAESLKIAPPTGLRTVASGPDCGAHVGVLGSLVCPDMMKSGDLLLIWNWQAGPTGVDAIDGYRVYAGNDVNITTGAFSGPRIATRPGAEITLFDVPKPAGGYTNRCYAVTAYAGNRESAMSAPFCTGSESAARTVTLRPIREISVSHWKYDGHDRAPVNNTAQNDRRVGYNYGAVNGGLFADSSFAWISRWAMLFDVKSFIGHRVVEAHLTATERSYPQGSSGCTNSAGFGINDWWTEGWPDSPFGDTNVTLLNGKMTVDATSIVALWFSGRFNQGIVLRNENENLNTFATARCESHYVDPVLSVTYY